MLSLRETNQLLKEVRKRSLLWDTTNPYYKDKVRRAEAWKEILEVIFPGTTERVAEGRRLKDLMNRWKSLRDSYSKHLRRIRMFGEDGLPSKPYVYARKLSFLDNYMTFRDAVPPSANGTGDYSHVHSKGIDYFQDESGAEEEGEEEVKEEQSPTTLYFECEEDIMDDDLDGIPIKPVKPVRPESELPVPADEDEDGTASTSTITTSGVAITASQSQSQSQPHSRFGNERGTGSSGTGRQQGQQAGQAMEFEQDPDVAFFASLLPTVRAFTEDQKLEFRTEALLVLRSIKSGVSTTVTTETSAAASSISRN